ncbi:MAG: ribose-5-phosphate isomerase RpiA [Proteobacteria bacterium]|nr:ribose-5-phosphate isomerase RpiA [Pseudomonadota bacterium]
MTILKQQAAIAAFDYIEDNMIIGIGTGSTVNYLIDALPKIKNRIDACVASSKATETKLKALNLPVIDLNATPEVHLYIDGADEVNEQYQMIKGGGGALTREKIIASAALEFICIVDESKLVNQLGAFPLAVEVLPMARSFVARELVKLGGDPEYREGFISDNGNIILDVYNLDLTKGRRLEEAINLIPGVLDNGFFAKRLADKVILASQEGIRVF